MASVSQSQADSRKQHINGHLHAQPEVSRQGVLRVSAIVVEEVAPPKKDFTASAQRILDNAETLAVQFNQTHITEAIFCLAILLDAEGFKQAQKHSIVVPTAFRDCWATLGTYRAPKPGNAGRVQFSEPVKQILDLARKLARQREDDLNQVGVEDLVRAVLGLPRGAADARDPIATIQQAARKSRGEGRTLKVVSWLSGVVLVLALAASAAYMLGNGMLQWTSLIRGFV
jgi:hypothetical protein